MKTAMSRGECRDMPRERDMPPIRRAESLVNQYDIDTRYAAIREPMPR
jgi:hypothetical protein